MATLAALNAELDKLNERRRELVAQRSRLTAERDSARLPSDINKAADELMAMNARIEAASRIIADIDADIANVTQQRDAAQFEVNKAKARELDVDCTRIQGDISRMGEALEKLIEAYASNRRQRAAALGQTAWPDNTYGHLSTQLQQLRLNDDLRTRLTFSER